MVLLGIARARDGMAAGRATTRCRGRKRSVYATHSVATHASTHRCRSGGLRSRSVRRPSPPCSAVRARSMRGVSRNSFQARARAQSSGSPTRPPRDAEGCSRAPGPRPPGTVCSVGTGWRSSSNKLTSSSASKGGVGGHHAGAEVGHCGTADAGESLPTVSRLRGPRCAASAKRLSKRCGLYCNGVASVRLEQRQRRCIAFATVRAPTARLGRQDYRAVPPPPPRPERANGKRVQALEPWRSPYAGAYGGGGATLEGTCHQDLAVDCRRGRPWGGVGLGGSFGKPGAWAQLPRGAPGTGALKEFGQLLPPAPQVPLPLLLLHA